MQAFLGVASSAAHAHASRDSSAAQRCIPPAGPVPFGSRVKGRAIQRTNYDAETYDTRFQSKIHSLANLAAARATCRLAAAARRSQARRGAQMTIGHVLKQFTRVSAPAYARTTVFGIPANRALLPARLA